MSLQRAERFWNWFDEARGDLTVRQVEKRGQVPRGRIGNARSGKREPTPLVCEAIAAGLGIEKNYVLQVAGIAEEEPDLRGDETVGELLRILKGLSPVGRRAVLAFARFQYEQEEGSATTGARPGTA
jgi:hypothetical protein